MNIYSVGVGVPEEVGRIRKDLISSKSKLFMNLKKKRNGCLFARDIKLAMCSRITKGMWVVPPGSDFPTFLLTFPSVTS